MKDKIETLRLENKGSNIELKDKLADIEKKLGSNIKDQKTMDLQEGYFELFSLFFT